MQKQNALRYYIVYLLNIELFQALSSLPVHKLPWQIPNDEIVNRKDLRQHCIFTIDPATARDLDDALSCEKLDDGKYSLGQN